MSMSIEVSFSKSAKVSGGLVVAIGTVAEPISAAARSVDASEQLDKAAKVSAFTGKSFSTMDLLAPAAAAVDRIAILGTGEPEKMTAHEWMRAGGKIFTLIRKADKVTVLPGETEALSPDAAADMALGLLMRAYSFDLYKTKKAMMTTRHRARSRLSSSTTTRAPARRHL
jgi:leucyl aminopeptidase